MLKVAVGDEVVLRTTWKSSRNGSVHTVKKITTTGKIRLSNGLLFDPFGRRIERGWGGMWLEGVVP